MAFRLSPDGSLLFDSLAEALEAQATLANRLRPAHVASPIPPTPSKPSRRPPALTIGEPVRTGFLQLNRLPHPVSLTPSQLSVLTSVALRDSIDLRELTALHVGVTKDFSRFMTHLREIFTKAGYSDGEILSRKVTGFGPNKRSLYSPGPVLMAALVYG